MKSWLGLAFSVVAAVTTSGAAFGQEGFVYDVKNILFVVDISGSMSNMLPGVKSAISSQVDTPRYRELNSGLIVFHGCGPETVSLAVPLAKDNGPAIKNSVQKLSVTGGTDLIAGLSMAKSIIEKLVADEGQCGQVILFTDHEDTCGNGNRHHQMVKDIAALCSKVQATFKLDVIALTSDEDILLYLQQLGDVVGGKVYEAHTMGEISKGIDTILSSRDKRRVGTPKTSTVTKPQTKEEPRETKKPAPQKKPQPAENRSGNGQSKEEGGNP